MKTQEEEKSNVLHRLIWHTIHRYNFCNIIRTTWM